VARKAGDADGCIAGGGGIGSSLLGGGSILAILRMVGAWSPNSRPTLPIRHRSTDNGGGIPVVRIGFVQLSQESRTLFPAQASLGFGFVIICGSFGGGVAATTPTPTPTATTTTAIAGQYYPFHSKTFLLDLLGRDRRFFVVEPREDLFHGHCRREYRDSRHG
jgi:hypothetical protein